MDLWHELCSYKNLELAFKKARKHKTTKDYVIKFESQLKHNLMSLRIELLLHYYRPRHLVTLIIHDSKTRRISKSDFRDRVIHHALYNIIEPILEKTFIFDSYANRKGKGTLKAVERFDLLKRRISMNNTRPCYILKADIEKYFENINHKILLNLILKKIKDPRVIWLIKVIHSNSNKSGKGMPLGNLTSQFFANVYLNELDQFVKHKLKAKQYIRYVDDFVIFHHNYALLDRWKQEISMFLINSLKLNLHKDKTKIIKLGSRINFLGFRIFYHHKLLKKSNIKRFKRKYDEMKNEYSIGKVSYDGFYDFLEGWFAYAKNSNTYNFKKMITEDFGNISFNELSLKEFNRLYKEAKV
jgi:RNA-directed DNA polymerase